MCKEEMIESEEVKDIIKYVIDRLTEIIDDEHPRADRWEMWAYMYICFLALARVIDKE